MGKLYILLETYGISHQNKVNKLIHWICVPLIMFSLIGLILHIPFVFIKTWYFNWASLVLLAI
ncbi:MAG: Mpo1-like protein, partial [Saprospiraceae bacterium]